METKPFAPTDYWKQSLPIRSNRISWKQVDFDYSCSFASSVSLTFFD